MITGRNKMISTGVLLLLATSLLAQVKTLTIEECYTLAKRNYPAIKKQGLIEKSTRFSLENAGKAHLPQLSVTGQASYQSQTISFAEVLPNIPGFTPPALSKDQYRIQAEVTQQIYDAGATKNQRELINANAQVQQQSLEVTLNTLKDRVTQIYFSVLMLDQQLKQNDIRKSNLQEALNKAEAAYKNGTSFKSNVDELKAELITVDEAAIEFASYRKAYTEMLSLFIASPVDATVALTLPPQPPVLGEIKRPELQLYDLQKKAFDIQEKQLKADLRPRLSAFLQGAYGRPTLNIIQNKFGAWWIGGVRLNWSLNSLYTIKNNKANLHINRQNIDVDKETFLFNTNLSLTQQNGDLVKYAALIRKDDALISLRSSVVQSSKAQLENGVITVHEYITKLNDENLATQARIVHNIQLLQAQYNYKNTSGN